VLLGHPVAHSLSPVFQQAALHAAGIPLRYELLDVLPAALASVVQQLRAERAAGNVTIPHKEAMHALCDRRTPLAERVGAVNTFWVDDAGALVGDNTDVAGFDALAGVLGIDRAQAAVACLGSGGAAAAVCAAVVQWPRATVRLHGRSAERAQALVDRFGDRVQLAASPARALEGARVVVNATPLGLHDHDPLPIAIDALPRDACVMDLVYRRGETRFVREARAAGHPAVDGLEMLLQQGVAAFERWFARAPNVEAMRAALAAVTGR
jgi:shikimate dehydrogenase